MKINEVIRRIGYFRNKRNLSARELSLRIDRHAGYINKLESKDFNLPTKVLLDILDVLEVSPEEFFAENYATYKTDKELYIAIQNLPVKKREGLMEFLK